MTNPLSRVAMKNLIDFKPVVTTRTTGKINDTSNKKIGGDEESLIKSLINGEVKAEGVGAKQVVSLEELANKIKNNY